MKKLDHFLKFVNRVAYGDAESACSVLHQE